MEFVRLEGPRLHLERSADGRITISKLLLKVLGAKGDSGDSAGSATLPILRVQGGRLDWIDRGAAGDPIELHLHPLHGGSAGHGTSGATLVRDDPGGLDCGGLGRKIVVRRPVRSAMTSCACSQPLTLYFQDTDIGYDAFAQPVTGVVTECQADRKVSLQDKIEAHF